MTTGGKFGGATAGVEIGGGGVPGTGPPVSTIGGSCDIKCRGYETKLFILIFSSGHLPAEMVAILIRNREFG